jgi:hypothetical protein
MSNRCLNLLPKNCWGAADADEVEEGEEKLAPWVGEAEPLPGAGKARAGQGGSPAGEVGKSGEAEGIGPAADARKEVALRVVPQVIGLDGTDVPPVDSPPRYVPISSKLPEPLAGETVEFVVVDIAHSYPLLFTFTSFPRTSVSSTSRFRASSAAAV